ncbi:MAG: T9SS type A sorting domain-containing protein [Bacteroidota bacterium]
MNQTNEIGMLLCLLWAGLGSHLWAQPIINSVSITDSVIEQYEKYQVEIDLSGAFDNPYDYDQIWIKATLSGPGGQSVPVDGFFLEKFILNSNGSLVPDGNGFQIRFAPWEVGTWTLSFSATDSLGETVHPTSYQFQCVAPTKEVNKGFVRTNTTNYLQFDNGDPYILVGENMAWQNGNAFSDYSDWLGKLSANGGNFFRLWHAHWGLGVEWKNGWNGFKGLRKYKPLNNRYQDWLYDFCAEKGIYIMLALQHHGPVSTQVNPNWNDSPYNTANGGPCSQTWEFFTNADAIAHTQNRYRYIVARWGYSRAIMSWELFNEVEWTDNYSTHKNKVITWHEDMATFLKSIDPYQHIVTTSFAHDYNEPLVWTNPDMDITQTHFYINTDHIERALVAGVRNYLLDYDKPTLTGEFGLGGSAALAADDPDGIHFHNAMWGALFGGGMGTAMTWWWDNYIHPKDLYYHFAPISEVLKNMPLMEKDMSPGEAIVGGTSGDLSISPTQGWGVIGEDTIEVTTEGVVIPASPSLSTYLYGSSWNTQYRSPPNFVVNYASAGTFQVKTGSSKGQSPRIAIWIDGTKVVDQSASTNQTFTANVPAGAHVIKVDNTGTDWITINSYVLSGLGSAADTYVLLAADSTAAAGWILNNEYTHEFLKTNGAPASVNQATLTVKGLVTGNYFVKWYDCLSGQLLLSEGVVAQNGAVVLDIPELFWDLAYVVDDQAFNVSVEDELAEAAFEVFPNPAPAGGVVQLSGELSAQRNPQAQLLDAAGKKVQTLSLESGSQAETFELRLPEGLATGIYWLSVSQGRQVFSKPLLITEN